MKHQNYTTPMQKHMAESALEELRPFLRGAGSTVAQSSLQDPPLRADCPNHLCPGQNLGRPLLLRSLNATNVTTNERFHKKTYKRVSSQRAAAGALPNFPGSITCLCENLSLCALSMRMESLRFSANTSHAIRQASAGVPCQPRSAQVVGQL